PPTPHQNEEVRSARLKGALQEPATLKRTIALLFLGGSLLSALLPELSFARTIVVWYDFNQWNRADPSQDPTGSRYPAQLLSLCLRKTGEDFTLQSASGAHAWISQERAILEVKKGVSIDVTWTMTSRELEKTLLPIRIPIDRGAGGWRVFLIDKDNQSTFDQVKTLDDLKKLVA